MKATARFAQRASCLLALALVMQAAKVLCDRQLLDLAADLAATGGAIPAAGQVVGTGPGPDIAPLPLTDNPSPGSEIIYEGECLSLKQMHGEGRTPIAEAVPQMSLFEKAMHATGEDIRLTTWPNDVTVFAPTDKAIEAYFSSANVTGEPDEEFFRMNIDETKYWIKYHVIGNVYTSKQLTNGQILETLDNEPVTVSVGDGGVGISADGTSAGVEVADIPMCHGVVHLIDNVLVPLE